MLAFGDSAKDWGCCNKSDINRIFRTGTTCLDLPFRVTVVQRTGH